MSSYQVAAIAANVAKKNQGFIDGNLRQGCANCQHGQQPRLAAMPKESWHCRFGGFVTTKYSICDKYLSLETVRHEKL